LRSPHPDAAGRIVALIAAHNEGDVIYHVLGDLIANGVAVYFIDNGSTDNTVAEAERWLGRGLLRIEHFPEDCGSCHQASRFCTECHARLGLSPISAPDVRAARRYHPPAAVWVRGPSLHGLEARRAMSTCVSCHAERDCVVCHGALGIGAGVSPHGAAFSATCGAALSSNARACVTCHGDVEALRRRCP
jgi:hypothetical protein